MRRGNGILAHIASLPSECGIGNLGAAAFKFIDRLAALKQTYWQVAAPLACTGGDPRAALDAFAGAPEIIDLGELAYDGLLSAEDYKTAEAEPSSRIDYRRVEASHGALLKQAYAAAKEKYSEEFADFKYQNAYWLFDYALYSTIRAQHGGLGHGAWAPELKDSDPEALLAFSQSNRDTIGRVEFAQFLFFKQLAKLREYADQNGITLICELPYYINPDCADAWAQPELLLPGDARVCPDRRGGELHIPYNWDYCRKSNFRWWMARIAHWLKYFHCLKIGRLGDVYSYDVCQDDGNNLYYGPGYDFNATLRRHMPAACLIAGEPADLGQRGFLLNCGFITTAIVQDAFEDGGEALLPFNMNRAQAYQTSRTDGSSTRSWFLKSSDETKQRLLRYFGPFGPYSFYASFDEDNVTVKLMRAAMSSVADVCIVPIADVLNLTDAEKLYNPEKDETWAWRMEEKHLDCPEMERLAQMTQTYGRE